MSNQQSTPLAIVGMACLFPKASGLGGYWANIKRGVDGITDIPASHWDPAAYHDADPKRADMTYARRGGFLDPVPFDAAAYGISPNNLEATDASQLLGLVVATEALKNAGYGPERSYDRDRVSVVLGVTGTTQLAIPLGARLGHPYWRKALADCGIDPVTAEEVVSRIGDAYVPWQENSFPGLLGNVVAGRIANKLDLGGTNCVVDAACASSLSAMHLAALELATGRTDIVITGGVDTFNDIFMFTCFSKTPALSPTGDSRPFSDQADGTMLGEGLGMVVLKRLADAERDGDHIYAVLKSIGTSSDGRGKAVYAPSDAGQTKALNDAYTLAGVTPDTIELVEAHGTGTKVGDATEVLALKQVYRSARREGTWCALGSVKSQIGHTKAAAGAAGIIKVALALHHKVLPPTIKVERPAHGLEEGASPFYVNTAPRPWIARPTHPRRAAVSAFGFGGSNFHAVLEEYQSSKVAADWDGQVEIMALAAPSREALEAQLGALAKFADWDALRVAAHGSRVAFDPAAAHRLVLVLEQHMDLARVIANALAQLREGRASWSTPEGAFYGEGACPGKLAVLFPGQGAQYPGMGRDLACLFPEALETLEEADRAFAAAQPNADRHGERLIDLQIPPLASDAAGRERQAERLRATQVAQPALGATSLGAWRALAGFGVKPEAFAGHSYGELAALCAAGRLTGEELHRLSNVRGALMAGEGGDRGSMLAVRMELAAVTAFVTQHNLDVTIANKNAPKQVVLSGATAAIEAAREACSKAGIEAVRLPVGAAFHSPLVADAAEGLAEALKQVSLPKGDAPVYANTTAAPYPLDAAEARALLAAQLARPVEFVAEIEALAADGIHTFVEMAPGARLTGLVRTILDGLPFAAIALDASSGKRDGVNDLARTLAQLAALGHNLDLTPWQGGVEGVRAIVERVPPKLSVPISGANHRSARPARPPFKPVAPVASAPTKATNGHAPAPTAVSPAIHTLGTTNGTNGHHPAPAMSTPAAANGKHPGVAAAPQPMAAPAQPAPVAAAQPVYMPVPAQAALVAAAPISESPLLVEALKASQESLVALQRMQEQTAKLHHEYLSGQDLTQQSFMALLDRQQQLFARVLGLGEAGGAVAQPASRPVSLPSAPAALPAAPQVAAPIYVPATGPVVIPPAVGPVAVPLAAPAPALPLAPAPTPAPAPQPAAAPAARAAASTPAPTKTGDEVVPALIAVVAEKTGYPPEMLDLDMALEADLGIDSIKRVEILSALQERLPGAPVIKPDQLGSLLTLRDVVAYMAGSAGVQAPVAAPAVAVQAPVTGGVDLEAALLAVVAEKTGYPVEMLGLEMALEADLGIDSIKRVEILSALQEAVPGTPAIQPEQLGALVTLGDVTRHLGAVGAPAAVAEKAGGIAPPTAAAPTPAYATSNGTAARATQSGGAAVDVASAVIATIAEKTGYPPEMLSPEMALEADLGIDSIKRVEILSALQEVLPGAPIAKPEHMGTLSTMSDLISFLSGGHTAPARAAAQAPAAQPVAVEPVAVTPSAVEPALAIPAEAPHAVTAALERYDDPATDAIAWEPITGLQRMILRAVPLAFSPERDHGKLPFGSEVWVAHDGNALGVALQDHLGALGFKVRGLSLLDEANWPKSGVVAGVFIVLGAADLVEAAWAPEREELLKASLRLTQQVGPALAASAARGSAAFVTVSRLDGAFGLVDLAPDADAIAGGLAGLAKTAALEWPEVACQAIDADRNWGDTAAIAAAIVAELYLDGPRELGLRLDTRMTLDLDETPIVAPASTLPLRAGELVVVTGGARGVTAEAAVALARYARPTLALLGRSPTPTAEPAWLAELEDESAIKLALLSHAKEAGNVLTPRELEERFRNAQANREILRTLARIEAEGARAVYVSLDVRNESAVHEAIAALRAAHGPVRALVHGAGVLADRRIGDLTADQVDTVLDTKLAGLRHLLNAMAGDPTRAIALFSSVTARRGRVGQVAYAMANEALDKVAQQLARKHLDRRVVAINWGPWDGGMVTPALKRLFAEEGVAVVPLGAGAEFLAQEMAQPPGAAVEVLVLGATPAATNASGRPLRLQTAFSRWLTPKQYPFLASHVMNGRAVLPVAVIVEWMAHGALHANPGLMFHGFRELRVFRGVVLDDAPYGIRVAAAAARKVDGLHEVVVELRGTGDNDALHARATMLLATALPAAPAEAPLWPGAGRYGRAVEDAYREVLFHGPDFMGITAIERASREGIVADVVPAPSPDAWIQAPLREAWIADPLAIDAAFQLMILWSVEHLQAPCLPAYAAEYRQYRASFPMDGVRVVVRVVERRGSQVIADIAFLDRQGALVARMRGAECTTDPGLVAAFRLNALAPSLQP